MKTFFVLILLSSFGYCSLEPVTIIQITDDNATNYYFSMVFTYFVIAVPSKIALQIIWNYARSVK